MDRFWPDLTAYGLSLWLERQPGDTQPPLYRFCLLAQDALTPEQIYQAKGPLEALGSAMRATLHTESSGRGALRAEWIGHRVPPAAFFLETFSLARIRPLDSMSAFGPWLKNCPLKDAHTPIAQWFWRAVDPPPDRIAGVPGRYGSLPYELWALTPEGAAAYGSVAPVTHVEVDGVAGFAIVGREPRNRGLWVLPATLANELTQAEARIHPVDGGDTTSRERADAGVKIGGARKDVAEAARDGVAGLRPGEQEAVEVLRSDSVSALKRAAALVRRDNLWKPPTTSDRDRFLENGGTPAAWFFRETLRKHIAASPVSQAALARNWRVRGGLRRIPLDVTKVAVFLYPFLVARIRDRATTWRTMEDALTDLRPRDGVREEPDWTYIISGFASEMKEAEETAPYHKAIQSLVETVSLTGVTRMLSGDKAGLYNDGQAIMALLGDPVAAALADDEALTARVEDYVRDLANAGFVPPMDTDAMPHVKKYATWGWGAAYDSLWPLATKIVVAERAAAYAPEALRARLTALFLPPDKAAQATVTDPVEGTGIPRRETPSPRFKDLKREGPARRAGAITEAALLETFGLRAVEYGNWVTAADRQVMLDGAYDSLFDMATALNVPMEFMGFYGRLGLALGARGRGGSAAAHYESGREVINLTKTLGSGTIAHEWAHALDDWIGRRAGCVPGSFASIAAIQASSPLPARGVLGESLGRFMVAIMKGPGARPLTESARQGRLRLLETFLAPYLKNQAAKGKETEETEETRARRFVVRWVHEEVIPTAMAATRPPEALAALFCQRKTTGVWMFGGAAQARMVRNFLDKHPDPGEAPQLVSDEALEEALSEFSYKAFRSAWKGLQKEGSARARLTDFHADAVALGTYWSAPHEMFARAFSAVIHDRMAAQGLTNDFASKYSAPNIFQGTRYKGSPNPEGEERARFLQEAVPLIATIQQEAIKIREAPRAATPDLSVQAAAHGVAP